MDAVIESLEDAQAGATDYLITGKEEYLSAYRRASEEAGQKLAQLTRWSMPIRPSWKGWPGCGRRSATSWPSWKARWRRRPTIRRLRKDLVETETGPD